MLQSNFNFPRFVGDQVLTSDALNDLVSYLEEQERMTRCCLIGIGNVCDGGGITIALDGTSLTMPKFCGVSSEGYLMVKDQVVYTEYKAFEFDKDNWYHPFCNDLAGSPPASPPSTRINKFDIWELLPAAQTDATPLTSAALLGKVIVAFLDMRNVSGQNCNPESCDGLGVIVETTVRVLMINQADIDNYVQGNFASYSDQVNSNVFHSLPELNINRFNVQYTKIESTGQFLAAYKKLFTAPLITGLENSFTSMYNMIKPMIDTEFESDPFVHFNDTFKFLYDGSLTQLTYRNNLIQIQYYYDFFLDLINTYNEIKDKGFDLVGACCPPSDLFPRHLFQGQVVFDSLASPPHIEISTPSTYYHSFIPTMIMGNYRRAADEIVMLFRRLVLLYRNFSLPTVAISNTNSDPQLDNTIRITPSFIGPDPLSKKPIPFYYNVAGSSPKIHENWNYKLRVSGKSNRNLSYHAISYNTSDNDVINPLAYDLEKFNFFRTEGFVGKKVSDVLYNLQTLRKNNQAQFEVTVVLTGETDDANVDDILNEVRRFKNVPKALFQDLNDSYASVVSEVVDRFLKASRVIYDSDSCLTQFAGGTSIESVVPFLKEAGDTFMVKPKTSGKYFEQYTWPNFKDKPYSSPFKGNPFESLGNLTTINDFGIQVWTAFFAPNLIYIMDSIYSLIKMELSDFAEHLDEFSQRWEDLIQLCEALRQFSSLSYKQDQNSSSIDMALENLEDAIFSIETIGKGYTLRVYGESYLSRINDYVRSLTFDGFVQAHPGMQHRCGTKLGGTLVLVMHTKAKPIAPPASPPMQGGVVVKTLPNRYSLWSKKTKAILEAKKLKEANCKDCTSVQFKSSTLVNNQVGVFGMQQFDALFFERMRFTFANLVDESVALENAMEAVPDGTILADFYLDYTISSELPPAQFSLSFADSPLFIDTNPRSYVLDGDKTVKGTLRYGPPGGVLTIPGYPDAHIGDFSPNDFNNDYGPSNAENFDPWLMNNFTGLKREVTITYTKDGKSVTTTVTIFKKPIASFTVNSGMSKSNKNGNVSGKFCTVTVNYNASHDFDMMSWTWGDGAHEVITPGNGTYSHVYNYANKLQFSIILTTFNGTFPSTPCIVTVNIPADQSGIMI